MKSQRQAKAKSSIKQKINEPERNAPMADDTAALIRKVVQLGQLVRRQRADGNLRSLPPPTISGYLAFLSMAKALPHLSLQRVALSTLLGNASAEDRKYVSAVFNEVFGLQDELFEDENLGGILF